VTLQRSLPPAGTDMARHSLLLAALLALTACAPGDRLPRSSASSTAHVGPDIGPVAPQEFRVLARLDVGRNPHQIVFTRDGRTAYVAAAGSGRVTRVDVTGLRVAGTIPVEGTPLGLFLTPDGTRIGVSRFDASGIGVYRLADGARVDSLPTPPGPSVFAGPYADDTWFVAAERGDKVVDVNGATPHARFSMPTGRRPFPPAATADGLQVFVPEYDDGTVGIFDLEQGRRVATVRVGTHPSGGTMLSDGTTYAVAVRGGDRVVLVSGAQYRVEGDVRVGIGKGPFSVVMAPGGRVAFVNNTGSDDVSVLSVKDRRVAARVPVGRTPIAMAVTPDGSELWVSCEGSHEVWVLEIPVRLR
jgi:YVTN family beta-propeller protein